MTKYVLTSPLWLTIAALNAVNTVVARISDNLILYVLSAAFMVIGINLAFTKEVK